MDRDLLDCSRCGDPMPTVGGCPQTQVDGGLELLITGWYGGFIDLAPVVARLCHDCSAWLARQVNPLRNKSKGGHSYDHLHDPCCEFGWTINNEDVAVFADGSPCRPEEDDLANVIDVDFKRGRR